ncbi:UNVERIFIED_CONTAM: hypothetical protein FKN15_026110 [Acipenser sinensis]
MCTGKCAKCIGVTLYPLAAISILCNMLLFFPDWSTRYMKEERVTAEVEYMGGLIGGGVMVLIPAIHIHATGRAGCCANRCGMFLSIAFAAAGVAGALYSFTVAILGLVNGPTCLFSFAGESVWGAPFSEQYYGRNESYLADRDLWTLCEEPEHVMEFNVALFSVLIVAGATELLLCGFQVVNGLFGCLCGTCGGKGISAAACFPRRKIRGVSFTPPLYAASDKLTIFVTLTCAFRYGREDLDVLGLSFRKDLYISTFQAFPPLPDEKKPLSRLQERLLKKLGEQAYPFYFMLYYHGEPISVNVHVTNNSTKTVKKVKISVRQYADICLFSTAQYKCPVAQTEAE